MESFEDSKVKKRKRGRPVGTTKTLREDQGLMRRAAAKMVREKHLKFSTALRGLGVSENKDLARLRKRWNVDRDTYLTNARAELRADQTVGEYLSEVLPLAGIFDGVQKMGRALEDSRLLPRLREIAGIAASVRSGKTVVQAPFDPEDMDALLVAITRLEGRDLNLDDTLLKKEKMNDPLSEAEQMYLMAVTLHAMALNQFEVEKQYDEDRSEH